MGLMDEVRAALQKRPMTLLEVLEAMPGEAQRNIMAKFQPRSLADPANRTAQALEDHPILGGLGPGAGLGFAGTLLGKRAADHLASIGKPERAAGFAKAEKMEAAGADADQIWREAGSWRGPDGEWRFEIPDRDAKIIATTDRIDQANDLSDVLYHPELYEAAPHLAKTPAQVMRQDNLLGQGMKGAFSEPTSLDPLGTIFAHRADPKDLLSTVLHEGTHSIQAHEGFAAGASPKALKAEMDAANKAALDAANNRSNARYLREMAQESGRSLDDLAKAHHVNKEALEMAKGPQSTTSLAREADFYGDQYRKNKGIPERDRLKDATMARAIREKAAAQGQTVDQALREWPNLPTQGTRGLLKLDDQAFSKAYDEAREATAKYDPFKRYERFGGEVEAVNVQDRALMDPEYLAQFHPGHTQKFPAASQEIVKRQNQWYRDDLLNSLSSLFGGGR